MIRIARLSPAWVVLGALLAGCAFALVTPAGLPYDEPSHWNTVRYIAANWRLPVLGEPGVTYEAQQTPLYYMMAAPLSLLPNGFLAVRLFGVVGHGLVTFLTWLLVRRILPEASVVALIGAGFMALNSVLLAIAGSLAFRARRMGARSALWRLAVVGMTSFGAWLFQVLFAQPVAFRTAYGVLPLVALGVGCLAVTGPRERLSWVLPAALCGAQLLISGWFLMAVANQPALLQP